MPQTATLLHAAFATHDVKRFILSRPEGLDFQPGQAVELALDRRGELAEQHLVFSNRTQRDVICKKELRHLLGDRLTLTCKESSAADGDDRRLDRACSAPRRP